MIDVFLKLKLLIIAVLLLAISFSAGKFLSPAKVSEKIVEKIVYREASYTEEDDDQITTQRTTKKSDGTLITETILEKKQSEVTATSKESESYHMTSRTTENKSQYSVGLYTSTRRDLLLTLDRRLFGGVSVGVYGLYDPSQRFIDTRVGVGLRLEF
jgi:sortase (surface protein transpeptidase)